MAIDITERNAVLEETYVQDADFYLNISARILSKPNLAEDSRQDAFVNAIRFFDSYNESDPIRNWLSTITWHAAIGLYRKEKRFSEFTLSSTLNNGFTAETIDEDLTSEEKFLQDELRDEVLAEIEKLKNAKQRAAILLLYFGDLSYQETSEVLGETLTNIKSLIHRAKQELKKNLTAKND